MKEIIEYVLAALIIASFIPIYDTVVNNIFYEHPIAVDQSTIIYISSSVRSMLLNTFSKGNFTIQLANISEIVLDSLNLSTQYGLGMKIESSGILKVYYNNGKISIYTSSPGILYLCLVYSDLSHDTVVLKTPTDTLLNGTIYYTYTPSRNDLIFISAIIETGAAKYIGYWVSDAIYESMILNINDNVVLAIPASAPNPDYIYLYNMRILNTTLLYYTSGVYHAYNYSYSKYFTELKWRETEEGNVIKGYGYCRKIYSNYIGRFYDTVTIYDKTYYLLKLQNLVVKRLYYVRYTFTRHSSWIDETLLDEEISTASISYPLYNLIAVFAKDRDGKVYYALAYPHSLFIGEKPPEKWPVYTYSFDLRIGMINYDVSIYVWRRYLS